MEQWPNALPALAYVKYLHSWLVVNHNSEPISWTDDAVEVAWLAEWVSGKWVVFFLRSTVGGQTNQAANGE